MSNDSKSRWTSLNNEINDFHARISKASPEQISSEALIEIAVQLMRLNAHLEGIENATNRVADST